METVASQSTINACFEEWKEIDPNIINIFHSYEKETICKLKGFIKRPEVAKKIWEANFEGHPLNDFENLSKDDCTFYFLQLEGSLALKAPGIHKVLKGHFL